MRRRREHRDLQLLPGEVNHEVLGVERPVRQALALPCRLLPADARLAAGGPGQLDARSLLGQPAKPRPDSPARLKLRWIRGAATALLSLLVRGIAPANRRPGG